MGRSPQVLVGVLGHIAQHRGPVPWEILLTEGQTVPAQRNAGCSFLGKNGAFLLCVGDTPG